MRGTQVCRGRKRRASDASDRVRKPIRQRTPATAGGLRPISITDAPTRVANRVPARLSHLRGLYEHRGDGA
jgi:hypothetical protein